MKIKYLVPIIFLSILFGQEEIESLAEKIKKVSEGLLEDYTQPLITSFGTGISTGLFHTARSHKTLGFDIGVRVMYIQIPEFAKYFDAEVLTCSLSSSNDSLIYHSLILDSTSTIFGPKERTEVPVSDNEVGIPPYIPGGFDLPGVPLAMPQLNVGLFSGSEILLRYIPITFKGSRINFLGLGVKQHLNSLPFMKQVPLPFDIGFGLALQNFGIQDSLAKTILNSRTWNCQLIISKDLIAFEPVLGFGLEGTKVYFNYDFEFELPDPTGPPGARKKIKEKIDVELTAQNEYRAIMGFNLKLGIFYIHYDYNLVPHYKTHNLIVGLTFR